MSKTIEIIWHTFQKNFLNSGPDRQYEVTSWLGSKENWQAPKRRYVGLLSLTEVNSAKQSFEAEPQEDSCWGDRAFSMYPGKFNPR